MKLQPNELEELKSMKDFIHIHFNQKISIRKLCMMTQMTPIRLQHAFKVLYTKPVYTYITELRMSQAAVLLTTSNLSIKEITARVGYKKTKKFSPMFKSLYGVTPTAYRKQHSA